MSELIILLLLVIIVIAGFACFTEDNRRPLIVWTVNDLAFMMELVKNMDKGDYKVGFVTEDGLGFYVNDICVHEENKTILLFERKEPIQ